MTHSVRGSEIIDIADAGRQLIRTAHRVDFALIITWFSSLWVTLVIILWLLTFGDVLPFDILIDFLDFLILFSLLLLYALNVTTLWSIFKYREPVYDFYDVFRSFWFKVKFEVLPRVGDDVAKDIWSKFLYLFPDVFGRRRTKVQFAAEVHGKEASHRFDIYSYSPISSLPSVIPTVKWHTAFVRILKNSKPAVEQDVRKFIDDIRDVLENKPRFIPSVLMLASHTGFTEEAVEYARGEGGFPPEFIRSTLLHVHPKRYEIAWTS